MQEQEHREISIAGFKDDPPDDEINALMQNAIAKVEQRSSVEEHSPYGNYDGTGSARVKYANLM